MEVAVHRSIAADVAETRHHEPWNAAASGKDEQSIRFESDDAVAAVQLRQSQSSEKGRYLARIVQRADRVVVISEGHHHAFCARVWTVARNRRPVSLDRNNF